MARFKFRLATLLRLREAARDEKRAQLAEAYRAVQILQERIQEVDNELAAARGEQQASVRVGKIDVDQVTNAHRYELLLRAQRKGLEQQQQTVQEEADRRRLALVEADRQVRVLEKLREKKIHEYEQIEARRDLKLMDELASRAKTTLGEVAP
jgi:flagellar FliJ protein